TIFPLLFVEQKLGWGRIPARYPTWLGVRDVGRRTVEFVLGLEAYATALERAAVQEAITRIRREWTRARIQAEKLPSSVPGVVRGIPAEPIASWPPEVLPTLSISENSGWVSLTEHLSASRKRLKELGMAVVPSAAQVEPRVQSELAQVEEQLS